MSKCKKCGADRSAVIINTNEATLAIYAAYKEAKTDLCLRCWFEEISEALK